MLLLTVAATFLSAQTSASVMNSAHACHAQRAQRRSLARLDYQCCATGHNSALPRVAFSLLFPAADFGVAHAVELNLAEICTSLHHSLSNSINSPPIFPLLI
jgi:hypothetical protein